MVSDFSRTESTTCIVRLKADTTSVRSFTNDLYCNVKFTVTVMMTGTGTPFSSVGVNSH